MSDSSAPDADIPITLTVKAMGTVYNADGTVRGESPVTLTGTVTRAQAEELGISIEEK